MRLGEGVFESGRLSRAAVARTLAAFRSFARTCRDLRVDKTVAFGTSALREASDSENLIDLLRRKAGIEVRVIPGSEEARLIAQGILHHEKVPKGSFAIVDVGGGSVEIVLCRRRRILKAVSSDLGVLRLQQSFLKTNPPKPSALKDLRRHVRGVLRAAAPRGGWPRVKEILGSGGTIRVLRRIQGGFEGGRLDAEKLDRMVDRLEPLSLPGLRKVPGMEPKRADFILAGAALMAEIAEVLEADDVRSTDFALRDGMLAEEVRLHGRNGGHDRSSPGFDLSALFVKALRMGENLGHVRRAADLAGGLFDGLRSLHGLGPAWRNLLLTAAVFHDAGKAVSPVHHERHTAYIVRHLDLPFLEPWERDFAALLCLWHRGGKVEPDETLLWGDAARRAAYFKLLGILRVLNALDHGHRSRGRLVSVRLAGRSVVLHLRGVAELELLRLEQKKDLLEKTLRIHLSAKSV